MPFSARAESVRKPYGSEYISNPQTLGEKIRNRRAELGLFQREVAKQLGVSEDTFTYWENGTVSPRVKNYPQIITFLEYFPFDIDVSTFSSRVTWYRYRMGLSCNVLGTLLQVDGSTISAWEKGKHVPSKKMLKQVEQMIDFKIGSRC